MATATTPTTRATVADVMKKAHYYYSKGQFAQAQALLEKITTHHPTHYHAWHLLAVTTHQLGNTPQAIKLITKALKLKRDNAEFHANAAEMLRVNKQFTKAITHGVKAVRLDPTKSNNHACLAACYFNKLNYKLAEKHYRQALQILPDSIKALNGIGIVLKETGRTNEAIAFFRQALALAPKQVETLSNLGSILADDEKTREEGLVLLHRSIALDPDFFDGFYNLGKAYYDLSNYPKARDCFIEALNIHAKHLGALLLLAEVYRELEELHAAAKTLQRAIEVDPKSAETYTELAKLYVQMNYFNLAKVNLKKATALAPKSPNVLGAKGHALVEMGAMEAAQKAYSAAIALAPENIGLRNQIIYATKVKPDNEHFLKLLKFAEKIDSYPDQQKMLLHFALGKCYEDIGEYKTSFMHFMDGCKLKRQTFTYDPQKNSQYVNHLIKTFNKRYIKRWSGSGSPLNTPIFVVGMPRSGTTLTEQIIASHPFVHGAGELKDLMSLIHSTGTNSKSDVYNQTWANPTKEMFAALGYIYIEEIKARAPDSPRVTDKMPANFFNLGLIHLALPNAKIIHVKRNPLDTCISGFTKLFGNGQHHSYDLGESGQYYYDYARLMDHWRNVLPEGSFIEVQYEELVADTEGQARRLIEYCGLEWSSACLNFHQTKRTVRTASLAQVRRPIYQSSLERWRHYEEYLWPLRNALKQYNPS
jgi:tetratricopeptide (TPR) repeat protein